LNSHFFLVYALLLQMYIPTPTDGQKTTGEKEGVIDEEMKERKCKEGKERESQTKKSHRLNHNIEVERGNSNQVKRRKQQQVAHTSTYSTETKDTNTRNTQERNRGKENLTTPRKNEKR
jgi:hypothetical protein